MNTNKPVVLIIMDGVGVGSGDGGDAVAAARTPVLDKLSRQGLYTTLKAHGTAVGLPSDEDMGNSEVGHNALGCGQVYSQGAKLVGESIESGRMFKSDVWRELVENCRINGTMHFIGLLSDANVHSNIAHLKAMLAQAKKDGVKRARVHILLDGRDVPPTSALIYTEDLENYLAALNGGGFDGRIASGGGRMTTTMDRYFADWDMVKRGWETHVLGRGRMFATAREAIETYRSEVPGAIDQHLPPFVIGEKGLPNGAMYDGDSVILFNFRGDRAIEISMAFDNDDFTGFDREKRPDVMFAGMLCYDGDLGIPSKFLVNPPEIKNTLTEFLISREVMEYAVSETQKFGHVTYFWNGNRGDKFSKTLEEWEEIPSDKGSFDERPWMKAADITDKVVDAMMSGKYGFIRANFPNGDMVGHTGSLEAAILAVETVDLCLGRIVKAAEEQGAVLIVTADHGNSDEMFEKAKDGSIIPKTAHTLNPVPFVVYGAGQDFILNEGNHGLSGVAATVAALLGLEPPQAWDAAVIKRK